MDANKENEIRNACKDYFDRIEIIQEDMIDELAIRLHLEEDEVREIWDDTI